MPHTLIASDDMRPNPTPHPASLSVVEGCRDCRRRPEPCKRCSLGHTTDRARFRPDTAFLQARTERVVHRLFGPNNIPQLTSLVSLSSRATSCRELPVAILRGPVRFWRSTTSHDVVSAASWVIKVTRSSRSVPPTYTSSSGGPAAPARS